MTFRIKYAAVTLLVFALVWAACGGDAVRATATHGASRPVAYGPGTAGFQPVPGTAWGPAGSRRSQEKSTPTTNTRSRPGASRAGATAPPPSALLLAPSDLPPGYVRDDALENADATARSDAYAPLVAASAFAGYRTDRAAVVHYVGRLHRRADAAPFLAAESAAVARTHGADRLTPPDSYGDAATLAYQNRSGREEWAVVLFADGPYVTMLGAYDASGEQAALDTLRRFAALTDGRLRAAARLASDPAPISRPEPPLRLVSLLTTTRQGRAQDTFRPHSAVYWHAVWRVGRLPARARETLNDWVRHGTTVLYRNGLSDRPFPGDNGVVDHLQLGGAAPGSYTITVSISIGRHSARATHTFRVVASPRLGRS